MAYRDITKQRDNVRESTQRYREKFMRIIVNLNKIEASNIKDAAALCKEIEDITKKYIIVKSVDMK